MANILEVQDLVKHFAKVQAVNGVSFSIPEGTCFGLLGPNGAGKTTTIEMIEGIKKPTSGKILFRGEPVGSTFREKSGIQFQSTALPDYLKVSEALEMFQSFYKDVPNAQERLKYLHKLCALEDFLDSDTHDLSGGQRQRVLLAIALVNDPDIVFLDEPTTGLDPQARRNFWELVQIIKKQKKTVVLTTHYMEEAYVLCDEIAIMDHGKIIAHGAPDQLLKKHFEGVTIQIPPDDFVQGKVQGLGIEYIERDGFTEIQTKEVNETLRKLIDANVPMGRLKVRSHTLEDLFITLTGKGLRT
jgi:ABC-2 type transport system ATP-binding protein